MEILELKFEFKFEFTLDSLFVENDPFIDKKVLSIRDVSNFVEQNIYTRVQKSWDTFIFNIQ